MIDEGFAQVGQRYLPTPVIEVTATGSVCEADVQRLRRDVFRDGVLSANEAEALCFLNQRCRICCKAWRAFFAEAVGDYIVRRNAPANRLSLDNADWLIERIATNGAVATAAGMTLLTVCLEEAEHAPAELVDFALAEARRAVVQRAGPLVVNPDGRAGLNDNERADLTLRLIKALVRHGGLSVGSVAAIDLDAGWRDFGIGEPLAEIIAKAA